MSRFKYLPLFFLYFTIYAADKPELKLSRAEQEYLRTIGRITMCVDPDWVPFEYIDKEGKFSGIASDLMNLISERLGIGLELIHTRNWSESLKFSQEGKCLILPFLNKTPERLKWLIFTDPLFNDPNVFVTREEHPFISDAAGIKGQSIVLPVGTSMESKIIKDYPNLRIVITETEGKAFSMVSNKQADMTLRSLIIAAYTIRKEGFFNLKIAGQLPEYTNYLRVGILKSEPMLAEILNKAIASISAEEREEIVNKHVYIKIESPINYTLIGGISAIVLLFFLMVLYWNYRLNRLNEERSILLDNIPIQVWYMTDNNTYGAVNKVHADFYGVSVKKLAGRKINKVLSEPALLKLKQIVDDVYATRSHHSIEEQIKNSEGEKRLLSINAVPKIFSGGKVDYVICSAQDITDRKKAESALKESEAHLRDLNSTKDKFFSIIAHDLKSPFQGLIGYSKILSEEYETLKEDEKISFIKNISELSNSSFKLLENLLDWSRMQTGKMQYDPEVVNLLEEITPTISLLAQTASNKGIQLRSRCDKAFFVNADRNMLAAIIRNLISNAIKFTMPGGIITFSAERGNDGIKISVSDSGVGISKERLNELFRLEMNVTTKGTGNEDGTGLGLLLCKEMVEKHGGKIWVESEVGKGTVFHFIVPSL